MDYRRAEDYIPACGLLIVLQLSMKKIKKCESKVTNVTNNMFTISSLSLSYFLSCSIFVESLRYI